MGDRNVARSLTVKRVPVSHGCLGQIQRREQERPKAISPSNAAARETAKRTDGLRCGGGGRPDVARSTAMQRYPASLAAFEGAFSARAQSGGKALSLLQMAADRGTPDADRGLPRGEG